eukprot:COSAG02_NODE_41_length_47431_cov_32.449204_20_plen_376_part_00
MLSSLQTSRQLGDLLAADETIVMGLLQQLTVPNILAGSVHPRAASFDVTESRSEPEPEPEPSVSYIQSPMPELHKTKFIGHWKASVAKNAKLEDECRTYGWPEADIIQAKSTRDPQALEKLLARAPQEVNEKERYLDSLLSVRYVEDKRAKKVMWEFNLRYRKYKKPDKSDVEVKICKRYSDVKAFHDQLQQQIKLDQAHQKKRRLTVMRSLECSPPPKEPWTRAKWNDKQFLNERKAGLEAYFNQLIRWEQNNGVDFACLQCFACAQSFFQPSTADEDGDSGPVSMQDKIEEALDMVPGLGDLGVSSFLAQTLGPQLERAVGEGEERAKELIKQTVAEAAKAVPGGAVVQGLLSPLTDKIVDALVDVVMSMSPV